MAFPILTRHLFIFLAIGILIGLLTACASDPFPAVYLYHSGKGFCDRYEVDSGLRFTFDKKTQPEACNEVYGFTPDDIDDVLGWVRRQKARADQ